MQYAESIDDYVRIMVERNNGGYANDWLVGDTKTGEIALFELGLKNWTVDRTKNGYFVGANFPVKPKLMKEETKFDPANKASSPNARRARWEQLMAKHKGAIDAELGKAFEADKYDVIEKRDGPTERSLCGAVEESTRGIPEWDWGPFYPGGTVQAKVMDAAMAGRLEMWAAMWRPCTTDFQADDLAKRPVADEGLPATCERLRTVRVRHARAKQAGSSAATFSAGKTGPCPATPAPGPPE
jgi:hypothetical protein